MPKLMWREPIETTTITSPSGRHRPGAAGRESGGRRGARPAPGAHPGDIAGRESGGLVVLLVASVR